MTTNPQVFEYRNADDHIDDPKKKRAMKLLSIFIFFILAALLIFFFWMNEFEHREGLLHAPNIKTNGTTHTPASQITHHLDSAKKQNTSQKSFTYIPLLGYFFIICLVHWIRHTMPKRCSLTLTDDAIIHNCQLPLGLNAFIPVSWKVSLRDITKLEFIQNPILGDVPVPSFAQLRINQREGSARTIRPAMWFVPGSPARQPLQPQNKPGLFTSPASVWMLPENQAIIRAAFSELPVVQALRERGLDVPDVSLPSNIQEQDLFGRRSVKFGIVAGLMLIITTLAIMIWHKHQHLQIDFPLGFYAILGSAALLILWLIDRQDSKRPPVFHGVIAVIFFVGGVTMSAQPISVILNGVGVTTDQSQSFVVHAGSLEPTGNQSGIGPIALPGEQSRFRFLKEGTTTILTIKKGRLGLWEYDDTPLRLLADAQGIQ